MKKAEELSDHEVTEVLVDKRYKGHKILDKKVYMSGKKNTPASCRKRKIKTRSAIEARISDMKNQTKLAVDYLKGIEGDVINALLCGVGHNMRRLLANNYLIILNLARMGFFVVHTR